MGKSNQTDIIDIDIAIIGAGPAGIGAALKLAKLGYSNRMVIFDRESQVAMTSRHCNHQGFGLMEFHKPMTGEQYANALHAKAKQSSIEIKLNYSLTKIDENIMTFSTPAGVKQYRAKRTLFAMGAREGTRASMLVSGGRSPNIINTGALQRFTYIQKRQPFSKAVIIGSELVSFSAIMTAKHAGIKIVAMIEKGEKIKAFSILKSLSNYILGTKVLTSTKLVRINTKGKDVISITISTDGKTRDIECDGVIFSGDFVPESSLLQKSFGDFNYTNCSLPITQNFQTKDYRFFLAGNVIRGALSAFNCYFEGQKSAIAIDYSLKNDHPLSTTPIVVKEDANFWYYPSLIDTKSPERYLTKVRFNRRIRGVLRVLKNGAEILKMNVDAVPYKSITVPAISGDIDSKDSIELLFEEG